MWRESLPSLGLRPSLFGEREGVPRRNTEGVRLPLPILPRKPPAARHPGVSWSVWPGPGLLAGRLCTPKPTSVPTAHSHSHGRVDDTLRRPVHRQDDGAIVVHVHQCHQRHQEDGEACGRQSVVLHLAPGEAHPSPAFRRHLLLGLYPQGPPGPVWAWSSELGPSPPPNPQQTLISLTSPLPPHHPGGL